MRLITGKVRRLEGARAAAAMAAPDDLAGLVWSSAESRIEPDQLKAGQFVAVDCYVDAWPESETQPITWRTRERATMDGDDLGTIYGPDGQPAGRVIARGRNGRLLRFELFGGPFAGVEGGEGGGGA